MFTFRKVLFNRYCSRKDYIYILIRLGIEILACHSKTITNAPHDKNKILITDFLELEGLIFRLTGRMSALVRAIASCVKNDTVTNTSSAAIIIYYGYYSGVKF